MDTFFDGNKKPTTMQTIGALSISVITLFVVVYVVGKAWKSSQNA
jgi:hypothetical protein